MTSLDRTPAPAKNYLQVRSLLTADQQNRTSKLSSSTVPLPSSSLPRVKLHINCRSNCPIDLRTFSPDSNKQLQYTCNTCISTLTRPDKSFQQGIVHQTRWLTKQWHPVPPCHPSSSTFLTLFRATSALLSYICNQPTNPFLRVPRTPSQQSLNIPISTLSPTLPSSPVSSSS